MDINKKIAYFAIIIIITLGFMYRLYGISEYHSFWSDEGYVSHFARELIQDKSSFKEILQLPGLNYQRLQVIITAISFWLLGQNEFAARLPSCVFGTLSILLGYLIVKKLSNIYGGILAGFMLAFSQMQLANSTQAKPYILIQMLLFLVIYITLLLNNKPTKPYLYHGVIIAATLIATFSHFVGVLVWIFYLTHIVCSYKKTELKSFLLNPLFVCMGILVALILGYIMQLHIMLAEVIRPSNSGSLTIYNHTTYLRELIWRNYAFIALPAVFGFISLFKKNRTIGIGVFLYLTVLIFLWNFRHYSHNIRYLVSLFGIMYLLFSMFWIEVGERLLPNKQWLTVSIIIVMLYVGGYKFVRKPSLYYSPNADLVGDVQMANYKDAFQWLKQKYPALNTYVIYNDVPDAQLWYLDGRSPDATFVKAYTSQLLEGQSTAHKITNRPIYTSLSQFKQKISEHKKGILIVEDWQSFLPDDIKSYAKNNLHLEYKIEGVPHASEDIWPIEIYSWGL